MPAVGAVRRKRPHPLVQLTVQAFCSSGMVLDERGIHVGRAVHVIDGFIHWLNARTGLDTEVLTLKQPCRVSPSSSPRLF